MLAQFNELYPGLDWPEHELPIGKVFLITDDLDADSSFLVHFMYNSFLKADSNVCLVSTEHAKSHYANVSRKLGVDLATAEKENRFAFVDINSNPVEGFLQTSPPPAAAASNSFSFQLNGTAIDNVLAFKTCVENALKESRLLVIDNLSTLIGIVGRTETMNVVNYFSCLAESRGLCLALIAHEIEDQQSLLSLINPTISLRVFALPTGASREVHGQIQISKQLHDGVLGNQTSLIHYRVRENGARFFAPGHPPP